jgi:hypothetical protein
MGFEVIYGAEAAKDIELDFKGVKIPIKVRELTWAEKTHILDTCAKQGSNGSLSFSYDKYMREVLSRIIVSAPWGETNQIFLNKISAEFGSVLEKLIPKAFGENQTDFLQKE